MTNIKKIQKPERLTKHTSIKITETEDKMLEKLAKKYKVRRNWLIRQAIQELWEQNS